MSKISLYKKCCDIYVSIAYSMKSKSIAIICICIARETEMLWESVFTGNRNMNSTQTTGAVLVYETQSD